MHESPEDSDAHPSLRTSAVLRQNLPRKGRHSLLLLTLRGGSSGPSRAKPCLLPRSHFLPYGLFSSSNLLPTPTPHGAVGVKTRWPHLPPSHTPTPPPTGPATSMHHAAEPASSMENIPGSGVNGLAYDKERVIPQSLIPVHLAPPFCPGTRSLAVERLSIKPPALHLTPNLVER